MLPPATHHIMVLIWNLIGCYGQLVHFDVDRALCIRTREKEGLSIATNQILTIIFPVEVIELKG